MKISGEKQEQIAGSTIPLGDGVANIPTAAELARLSEQLGAAYPSSAEWESRDLSDWELALGVVADDPKSLAWQLKVLVLICWGLGVLTGVLVVAPLLRAILAYLGGQ